LLRESGYAFERVDPSFDDTAAMPQLGAELAAPRLAALKAASVPAEFRHGIVLGCDTLLDFRGRRIGKPRDAAEARRILRELMGRTHRVVTGVAMIDAGSRRRVVFTDVASVRIGPLSRGELERYLESGAWRGKAGGYNLAELRERWSFTVRGDPTTVIGLPMRRLAAELKAFGRRLAISY
jgi:septum formation protein